MYIYICIYIYIYRVILSYSHIMVGGSGSVVEVSFFAAQVNPRCIPSAGFEPSGTKRGRFCQPFAVEMLLQCGARLQ